MPANPPARDTGSAPLMTAEDVADYRRLSMAGIGYAKRVLATYTELERLTADLAIEKDRVAFRDGLLGDSLRDRDALRAENARLTQDRDAFRNENALMAAHQGIDNYQRCLDTIDALRARLAQADADSVRLYRGIAFFVSAVKCGVRWDDYCQKEHDAAARPGAPGGET